MKKTIANWSLGYEAELQDANNKNIEKELEVIARLTEFFFVLKCHTLV